MLLWFFAYNEFIYAINLISDDSRVLGYMNVAWLAWLDIEYMNEDSGRDDSACVFLNHIPINKSGFSHIGYIRIYACVYHLLPYAIRWTPGNIVKWWTPLSQKKN